MRSRRSCRNSLRTMPHQRVEREAALTWRSPQLSSARLIRWMKTSSRPVVDRLDAQRPCRRWRARAPSRAPRRRGRVTCSAEPKATICSTPGVPAQLFGDRAPGRSPCTAHVASSWRSDDLVGRALRQQLAVGDVGELVAALGLVHVVRADQHRDAARREPVQLFPEVAPRLRIDAGGRLVEQQQLAARAACRRRARAAASSRPRASRRAASRARCRPSPSSARSTASRRVRHLVDARDEVEVLADRQVLPEREALRHVADVALDLVALAQDVVAEAGAGAGVRREQAAHHADRGGLAAAVRAEEAEDLAALHLQRQVLDDVLVAEVLVQPVHVDRRRVGRARSLQRHRDRLARDAAAARRSGAGRASTMKTSLARVSLL